MHTDFLNAKVGENASYMWRSIMAAQDVLKQGSRRKIGTGDKTYIWKVPWLPSAENGFLTSSMPPELEFTKACQLMEENEKRWDVEILNDICNDRDAQLILQIPLVNEDRNDSWLWLLDDKGNFTVKSCYRKLVGEYNVADAWFWKKLWALEVPGKVGHFIWRVCRTCLPTAAALTDKRVNIDNKCTWCRMYIENAKHVLFECSFAKQVWEESGLENHVQVLPNETMVEVFKRLLTTATKEQNVLVVMLCWSIWNRRNKWVWDRIDMSVFGTRMAAVNLLMDWKRAQLEGIKQKPVIHSSSRRWQLPQDGWVKINIDAATFAEINAFGLGSVIRDTEGNFLHAMCRRMEGMRQAREIEAISLKEALTWTKRYGFTRCVFETDSKLLAEAFNGRGGNSYFHSIVKECVAMAKHFNDVVVQFAHRSANEVAHRLARASHSMSGFREWSGVAPEFLVDVISYDLI